MKKTILFLMVLAATFVFGESNVKVYRDGEVPSVDELKSFFRTSKEAIDVGSKSRLGKSKGLTIGGSSEQASSEQYENRETYREISLPIKFANNSYKIQNDPDTMQILSNIRQALLGTNIVLIIEGHTNAVGSRRYNYELSQKRANAVKEYLVSQGVRADNLLAIGVGFDRPIKGSDPKDAVNRRVQFKVAN